MKSLTGASILDLKITYQCNNLCRFCVAGDKRARLADIPAKEIKGILKRNARGRDTVVFTGGEPTLRDDLFELAQYARECGYSTVIIQTNGRRLAYRSYAERLAAAGANQFSVSLHGHCFALHDYLTRRPDSFAETVLGIRNLLDLGLTVATNTVVTKSGHFNLPDIAALLCGLGVRQMQFAFPHIEGKALENVSSVVPLMSLAAPNLRLALDAATAAGRTALAEGFPLCMLKHHESRAVESIPAQRKVVDSAATLDKFHEHRKSNLKAKGPLCPSCSRFDRCEGPWADYPELFSWKEFQPIQ